MITQIRIKKYRTCENVRIVMKKSLMALIGKNAVGKSNTLKGIYLASSQILPGGKSDELQPPKGFTGEFVFMHKREKLVYTIKIRGKKEIYILDSLYIENSEGKIEIFNKNRKVSMRVIGSKYSVFLAPDITGLAFLFRIILIKKEKRKATFMEGLYKYEAHFIEILTNLLKVKYYEIKDQPNLNPILERDFEKWKEKSTSIPPESRFSCQYYDFYKNRRKDFNEFVSIAKSLDLANDIFVYEPKEKKEMKKSGFLFFPLFLINNNYLYFNELSDGTQRVILLLIHLLYDKPSLMLIEEPESSIHYGLLIKLLSIFSQYSNGRKVLIATHSEQILNTLEPEQIAYLHLKDGMTKVKYVTGRNLKNIRKYLEEVGPLGEYITSGELEDDLEG